ncbi:hypothetical protein FA13DRAFT_1100387 [Coprinellus micaceus]|uniref:Uncharacterized protein n=1 Tax=Coprinellus micaceus TaxID=71717 RepID=A0A4Y7SWG8_COPMI|nr:hypothetical protein FA13DRAFT_1100387 [Coprinellus micaceus]
MWQPTAACVGRPQGFSAREIRVPWCVVHSRVSPSPSLPLPSPMPMPASHGPRSLTLPMPPFLVLPVAIVEIPACERRYLEARSSNPHCSSGFSSRRRSPDAISIPSALFNACITVQFR